MSYANQRLLKCRDLNLNAVLFYHTNDPNKYVFSHWNTERDDSGTSYTAEQIVNLTTDLTLYAIWKERQQETVYDKFVITASNVSYDKTYVDVNYSIYKVVRYVGTNFELSRQQFTGTGRCDNSFSMNGTPGSDTATKLRNITVYFTYKDANMTASTSIIQYGYTPIYSFYGKANADDGKIKVLYLTGIENIGGVVDSNTRLYQDLLQKNITITAIPNAGYEFVNWTGSNIQNVNAITTVVIANAMSPLTIIANFKLKPLLQNAVIGRYSSLYNYCKLINTTTTDYRYTLRYYLNGKNTNWSGYYIYEPYSHNLRYIVDNYLKNKYLPTQVLNTPYTIVCPKSGTFKINGVLGTDIYYYHYYINNKYYWWTYDTGGFYIYHNGKTKKEIRETINRDSSHAFSAEFTVQKGDNIKISNIFYLYRACMSIWVEKAEIV